MYLKEDIAEAQTDLPVGAGGSEGRPAEHLPDGVQFEHLLHVREGDAPIRSANKRVDYLILVIRLEDVPQFIDEPGIFVQLNRIIISQGLIHLVIHWGLHGIDFNQLFLTNERVLGQAVGEHGTDYILDAIPARHAVRLVRGPALDFCQKARQFDLSQLRCVVRTLLEMRGHVFLQCAALGDVLRYQIQKLIFAF